MLFEECKKCDNPNEFELVRTGEDKFTVLNKTSGKPQYDDCEISEFFVTGAVPRLYLAFLDNSNEYVVKCDIKEGFYIAKITDSTKVVGYVNLEEMDNPVHFPRLVEQFCMTKTESDEATVCHIKKQTKEKSILITSGITDYNNSYNDPDKYQMVMSFVFEESSFVIIGKDSIVRFYCFSEKEAIEKFPKLWELFLNKEKYYHIEGRGIFIKEGQY